MEIKSMKEPIKTKMECKFIILIYCIILLIDWSDKA